MRTRNDLLSGVPGPLYRFSMNRCNREHLVRKMADKERALIAKYYDEDGNLVKRRRTRQQAKLASCVSSIQEFEASEIHTLPDEVLLLVFSRMQSAELLPLRLVCPRWNQLVLDPTVWRRREIVVSTGDWSPQVRGVGSTDLRTAASVLYVAPMLETLEIPPVRYLRGEKLMMAALLEGRCQMRSLTCDLALRVGADVHSALFRRLQPSLVALDVGLSHGASQGGSGMAAIKRHLANALELLDDSPLERLALRGSRGYSYPINLQLQDFEFKKLETLQSRFVFASWSSRGGWKENAIVMRFRRVCTTMRTYLPGVWRHVLNHTIGPDGPLQEDCPIRTVRT
ncbi:uncharacterized protein LOC117653659 [Thrips palmi]|uniref:Uncharacterized protein LOC117653659 n=1 Tax=Thrips palmi TaxID=161013 RepID=A0A6P9AIU9_THRPL|nr:uncharacterized protein LOC117653659 [Thrips palmi]